VPVHPAEVVLSNVTEPYLLAEEGLLVTVALRVPVAKVVLPPFPFMLLELSRLVSLVLARLERGGCPDLFLDGVLHYATNDQSFFVEHHGS
jgi:hypothetical protein